MKYRGLGLIRVSTEEQANEAAGRAGVLRQREDIRSTSSFWNVELVQTIEIVDVSGTTVQDSPEFVRMLELLKQPTIDGLIVSSLDRLVRPNDFTAFSIFDVFLRHRKLIFTPAGPPINVAEDPGFVQVLVGGMVAGIERKTMLRRIYTAKEENRKRGRLANAKITLPLGVDFDFQTGRWTWVEPHASRVKDAFSLVLQGHSIRSVAKRLSYGNARTLYNHLRNPIWTGIREYKFRRGEEKYLSKGGKQADRKKVLREKLLEVPIAIDPLVSREDFLKLQEILDVNKSRWASSRAQGSRFEAIGIARCACGDKLYSSSGKRQFGGLRDYYRCRSRQLKTGCMQKPVKREELDYTIQEFIRTFFTEPDILRSLLSKNSGIGAHQPDGQQQRLEQARAEINRLSKERAKLLTLAVKGLFSEERLQEEARRIDSEVAGWNAVIRQVERGIRSASAMDEKAVAAAVASIFAEFEFLNPSHRKALLQKFVASLYVDHGAITKVTVRLPPEVAKMCIHMGRDWRRRRE